MRFVLLFFLLAFSGLSFADEARVAVAANFTATSRELVNQFEQDTSHSIKLSFASSGKIYAQIVHGAPFHLFLSADQEKPQRLIDKGFGIAETRFTYATGVLVLVSNSAIAGKPFDLLQAKRFNKLALANAKLAPYGVAAQQALTALNLLEVTRDRWVQGENVLQVYQFVSTGNAELGLVAKSQVVSDRANQAGSFWIVPQELYHPIYQDGVLLKKGRSNRAAQAFMAFLQQGVARDIIAAHGYQ